MERYTSGHVWRLLTEGVEDPDELIDLDTGLGLLSPGKQAFLRLIQSGYSVGEVVRKLGLKGHQTMLKRSILWELVFLMNNQSTGRIQDEQEQEGLEL